MHKQDYIEKLRDWAESSGSESYALGLLQVAQELEQMDVVWVPREPNLGILSAACSKHGPGELLEDGSECIRIDWFRKTYRKIIAAAENTND